MFVLVSFFVVWRVESGWKFVVTPFLFLAFFELVRVLPPFFIAGQFGVTDEITPLMAALLAYISALAGFVLAYGYKGTSRTRTVALARVNTGDLPSRRGELMGAMAVLLVLIGSGLWLFGGLPPVGQALAGMFSGDDGRELAGFVSERRFELTKGAYFGAQYRGQGLINSVQRIGWTLMLGYLLLRWLDRRRSRLRLAAFAGGVFLAWMFVAGDGTRGPFLNVMMVVVAVYSLRQPLSARTVTALFAGGFALAIGLSMYSNKMYSSLEELSPREFIADASAKITNRIVLGNGMNDVIAVDLVENDYLPKRWGRVHFRDAVAAIPGVNYGVPLAHELYVILNPGGRRTTFLSGTYLSTVYVDFGMAGLVPIFLLIGMAIGKAQLWLFSRVRTQWRLAAAASLAFMSVQLLRSGFIGIGSQLIVFGALLLLHALVARFGRVFAARIASTSGRTPPPAPLRGAPMR
ncbi:hypothetical protein P873_13065 [Arenimonas composti TR7-09 = DSM 18010]|uniref:Oligosaccharide repeat unit polymerase n=1 Tax=Arenimonas composti TR7-09 = DSM 18010 TaxID=1121013 RepID=A0A091BBK1_9GAMM|nr:hypothetical protein P873_13065 [Arenimonas composti TR7-09 = DSM 18010]